MLEEDSGLRPEDLFFVEEWTEPGGSTNFWGQATPGTVVTITTPAYTTTAVADSNGDWGTESIILQPGDLILAEASGGVSPVSYNLPDPYFAQVDTELDRVSGQVGGSNNEWWEIHGWWDGGDQDVQTDETGAFVADFADIPPGASGYIRQQTDYGGTQVVLHRKFLAVQPQAHVNYAHDWVSGDYEPDHQVQVTVEDSLGDLKASAEVMSGPIPWWDNRSGFEPQDADWDPARPDLVPGDLVEVSVDGTYSTSVKIGTIDGALDLGDDTVSGTISAPWFTEDLYVWCSVWADNGPGVEMWVDPDGGSFSCDFGSFGWDLVAGQDVGVQYQEPDSDWVYNVLREPAPNLGISTWGDSEPTQDGNFAFWVEYGNSGDADAQLVSISSVLEGGLLYLSDTFGVAPSGTGAPGDPLVWDVGDLPADNFAHRFQIFAQVTASESETVTHTVSIDALAPPFYQGNWWDMQSTWSAQVVANDTHLNIGKGTWTQSPIPGSEFVYNVNVCNNGATSSSEVTLTDDLPPETSLVSWWAREGGWQEVSTAGNQVVLSIPTIPGWGNCREVYIRAALDGSAKPNDSLYNRAEIQAANDIESDDNVAEFWHDVGDPNYVSKDVGIWKDWHYGQFVPGGYVSYEVRYQNNGQVPITDVRISETLPANTTFIQSAYWDESGMHWFVPSQVTSDTVVWDIGTLDNGYGGSFTVDLEISESAQPGDLLENVMEITQPWGDERWDNNRIVWVDPVNEPGPNLMVYLNYGWDDMSSLNYEIRVHNVGTEWLEDQCIVDTIPEDTEFTGDAWFGHGPWTGWDYDANTHELTFCTDGLTPGETASAAFRAQLDPEVVGERGLGFTNTVSGQVEGDVNPLDNTNQVTATSAADVFVQAELFEGEASPGETFTLAVQFGNQARSPWNTDENLGSHISVTLPADIEFISATHPYNTEKKWYPEYVSPHIFRWVWGTMWSESSWTYFLTLRVKEGFLGKEPLQVMLEAYGDNPDEVELNWDNNTDTLLFNPLEFLHLPVMFK